MQKWVHKWWKEKKGENHNNFLLWKPHLVYIFSKNGRSPSFYGKASLCNPSSPSSINIFTHMGGKMGALKHVSLLYFSQIKQLNSILAILA